MDVGEGTRELVEARIRALIARVAAGDDGDGAMRRMIAVLYGQLGMRSEAAHWLVVAALHAKARGNQQLALQLADAARHMNPESVEAAQAFEEARQR